jgi:hypothetical protein
LIDIDFFDQFGLVVALVGHHAKKFRRFTSIAADGFIDSVKFAGFEKLHKAAFFDPEQHVVPVFFDKQVKEKIHGNKKDQRNNEASQDNRVVKVFKPEQGNVVERGPKTIKGIHRKERQTQLMKKRIKKIGNTGEEQEPEEKRREIRPQNTDQKEYQNVVQTHQGCQTGNHGKTESQAYIPRFCI